MDHVKSLKECSGQCFVLIFIHIVKGNEKLCKIYFFKKLFFQNILVFIDPFYRYHYQIACDVMCVQNVIQRLLHSVQKKTYKVFFFCRPWFLLEKIETLFHI